MHVLQRVSQKAQAIAAATNGVSTGESFALPPDEQQRANGTTRCFCHLLVASSRVLLCLCCKLDNSSGSDTERDEDDLPPTDADTEDFDDSDTSDTDADNDNAADDAQTPGAARAVRELSSSSSASASSAANAPAATTSARVWNPAAKTILVDTVEAARDAICESNRFPSCSGYRLDLYAS